MKVKRGGTECGTVVASCAHPSPQPSPARGEEGRVPVPTVAGGACGLEVEQLVEVDGDVGEGAGADDAAVVDVRGVGAVGPADEGAESALLRRLNFPFGVSALCVARAV